MTKKHYILLPSALHTGYTVQFKDGADNIGPEINITVEQVNCNPVSLIWLNARGGFDSYAFDSKREEEVEAGKRLSRSQTDNLVASQYKVEGIESKLSGVLQSEFLDEATLELISGVIESPLVYLVHLDNGGFNYVPVTILTSSLPKKSIALRKVEIAYEVSIERLNQNSLNVQPFIPEVSTDVEWQNLWS